MQDLGTSKITACGSSLRYTGL